MSLDEQKSTQSAQPASGAENKTAAAGTAVLEKTADQMLAERKSRMADQKLDHAAPKTEKKKKPEKPKKQPEQKPAPIKGRAAEAIHRHNRSECRSVLARWKRTQKREAALERLYKKWVSLPNVAFLADALYLIGYWAEYLCVRMSRTGRSILLGLGHEVQRILLAVLGPLGRLIVHFLGDAAAPFREIAQDVQATAAADSELTAAGKRKKRRQSRIALYLPVAKKAAAYLFPVAALVLFSFTIRSILASSFLLEVHVNGKTVGYVQSEQIFEGAKEDVQERIANAKSILASAGVEQSDEEWQISPTYTLATEATRNGRILSQHAMTDAILSASSGEITEGNAVYVDGSLLAILSTEDDSHLSTYLENLRTEAQNTESFQALKANPDLTDVRIEFEHDIQHGKDQSGVYFTSTVSSYDSVLKSLQGGVTTETYYQAQRGDTAESIATLYGIGMDALYTLNPALESGAVEVKTGDIVTIPITESLLDMQQKATVTWQETIAYDTVNEESDNYLWGDNRVEQEGSDGLKELTADIVFQNGAEVSRNVTNENVLIAPVTKIVVKGTKLPSGMTAQYGSGTFIWPVPTYTYVSRWMSSYHNGADICAGYGAPILASDSGVVITSDYHYSYGNYVVIDHGNGYRTLYAHMSQRLCSVGDAVRQGQQIGCIGSTGNSTGNHCHFEMYYNGVRFSAQSLFGGMRK